MKRTPHTLPLLLLLAAACAPAAADPRSPAPQPAVSSASTSALVESLPGTLLAQVNEARADAGRPPLVLDPVLQRAAQRYADELARRQVLDHESPVPGRRTFIARLVAEGARRRGGGENLAALMEPPGAGAVKLVQRWLDSPYHRTNLLEPTFTHTGIGVSRGRDGVWYVAEEYATAR